jgi:hypothetical protein
VFGLATVLSNQLSSHVNDAFPAGPLSLHSEAGRRQFYLASVLLFFFGTTTVMWLAVASLKSRLNAKSFWAALLVALVIAVVALLLSGAFNHLTGIVSIVYHSLDNGLFAKLFGELAKTKSPFDARWFGHLQFAGGAFGAAAAAIVIVGCLSCISDPRPRDAVAISEAAYDLRQFLFLGAVTLTTGLLLQRAWMLWPSALLDEKASRAYGELVDSVIAYNGAVFSLTLAAFYFPAWIIISKHAEAVGAKALATSGPVTRDALQDWKRKHGLDLTGPKSTLALLAPFVTGAAGVLFGTAREIMI